MRIIKNAEERYKFLFVLISALYYHSIMLERFRIFTYFYFFFIPIAYLCLHFNWTVNRLKRLFQKEIFPVTLGFIIVLCASVCVPIVKDTNDFTYFNGPLMQIIKTGLPVLFLVAFYEHHVDENPTTLGFLKYYVFSNVLYVIFTVIMILNSRLRDIIISNVYMTERQKELADASFYVSRIGWSGFSGFNVTFDCTLSVVICAILIIYNRKDNKQVVFYNILLSICLIGNMCYGRVGLLCSVFCIIILMLGLFIERSSKWIIYPLIFILIISVFAALVSFSDEIAAWYHWTFAQIEEYKRSGSVETHTVERLLEMYIIPDLMTFLFGDGMYTDGKFYYMKIDVGWLRPIYFYGVIFTFIAYFITIRSAKLISKRIYGLNQLEKHLMFFMMFAILIIYELKGEIFYAMFYILFPVLLLKDSMLDVSVLKLDEHNSLRICR